MAAENVTHAGVNVLLVRINTERNQKSLSNNELQITAT
jgi:hypothetical protein